MKADADKICTLIGEFGEGFLNIGEILPHNERCVIINGVDWIHGHKFFTALSKFVRCRGDKTFYLVSSCGMLNYIELDVDDSEDVYFSKIGPSFSGAGEGAPSFSYQDNIQYFIGSRGWVLVSNRNAEQMTLAVLKDITFDQLAAALELLS